MAVLDEIVARFAPKTQLRRRFWLSFAIPLGMILLAWVTVGDLATHPDNLPGIDTYWHVTLIDEAVDRFLDGEPMGPISETINTGSPYLYDTDGTYPQFVYWVSILVALVVGGAGTAYGVLMFGAIAMAQLTFYFGFRSRVGIPGALIGSFAFAYAPFSLTAVSPEGRYPALLAVSTTPLILAGIMSLIDRPRRAIWAMTVAAVVLSVAFHAMIFYIAVVPIGFIGFLYALDLKVGPKRLALAMSAIVIGILVAWILLPDGIADLSQRGGVAQIAATSTSVSGRADVGTASNIVPFSIRWNSFDVSLRLTNLNYAGLGLALATLLTIAFVRHRSVVIFGLGALLAYVLATGSLTPIWDQIPLASRLEPRRFLFPAYLGAGLVIATGTSFWIHRYQLDKTRRSLVIYGSLILVVFVLLLVDVIPMARRIAPLQGNQFQEWTSRINENDIDGRLFWNSGSGFATYYFGGRETDLEVVGRIAIIDADIRAGYEESAVAELALRNIRSVMTDDVSFGLLPPALESHGFTEIGRWESRVLLASQSPGSIFMNQTVDVGLFGSASRAYWSKIFPNSVPIDSPSDIRTEVLDSMKIIVLSGYSVSEIESNENVLRDFVTRGGIVIFEEPNTAGQNLFGIRHSIEDVPRDFSVPSDTGLIDVLPFDIAGQAFRGVSYGETGELTLAGITSDGGTVRLVQKSEIGEGAIYWICCNITNHIVEANDRALGNVLYEYFESEAEGFRSVWPTAFESTVERSGPSDFSISYSADEDTPVLVSLGAANRRVMKLESGEEIELSRFGPILTAVFPSGTHTISLSTRSQPISMPVTLIWMFGLGLAGLVLSAGWQPMTRVGGSYVGVVIESTRIMARSIVRLAVPLWGGAIEISGGSLKAVSPQIVETFDVYVEGSKSVERHRSLSDELKLASVFVMVKASKSEQVSFSVEQLRLTDGDGNTFEPITGIGEVVDQSPEFELHSILGKRQNRLRGEFILQPGESVSGHVVFEFGGSGHVEYLYVDDEPENRIEFLRSDDSTV